MTRKWDLDALRGLMLVLMALTHLPTRFSVPSGQPFGHVSAAEGFVLLSAFMAGMIYTQRKQREGDAVMRQAFFKRALKIYRCHAALLLFLFTVIAAIGVQTGREAVLNMLVFYLEKPVTAIVASLLLVHNPPLLDILPMYIGFMALSPVLLLHGLNRGWLGIMAGSVALWLACQFDAGLAVYNALAQAFRIQVPVEYTGSFAWLGWQFLWVLGLWMGSRAATPGTPPERFPLWLVASAAAVAMGCLVWRHVVGQVPFPGNPALNLMFDKWHLGPLRVINLFALLTLTLHFSPLLRERLPRPHVLETLGCAALPVFCAHLVLALLALAIVGESRPERLLWIDVTLLGVSFAVLYLVARVSVELDRHAVHLGADLRTDLKTRGAQRVSADRRRSPVARANILPR